MKYIERKTKRIFDITVALFCIVVCSPLYIICYIAIIIDDGRPALFSQERIGYKGKAFKIHKFRTMRLDAEESGPQLYNNFATFLLLTSLFSQTTKDCTPAAQSFVA